MLLRRQQSIILTSICALHEALRCSPLDDLDHRRSTMRASCDVKKDHLVSALIVVAESKLHGVAHVAQATLFGTAELHSSSDFPLVHIKAGNDAFCQHERV